MMIRFTRYDFSKALLALILSLLTFTATPTFAGQTDQRFRGAAYQANGQSSLDFRDITTLSDFDLLVARNRWNGIDARDVLAEFAKFNGVQGSPSLREIWHNVLLGDFSGLNIDHGAEQSALMAERIRLLNRLGYFDDAARLYLQASKKKPIPEAVALQGIDALALSGAADGACLEVVMAASYLQGDVWKQNAALCSAYFGETDKAQNYYAQVKDASGSGFRAVYKMLANNSGKTINVGIPSLWRTLLLAKGAAVSQQALNQSDGLTASALAQNEKVPFGIRLAAANRAADYGTIGPDKLRKLYEIKNPTAESVDRFITEAQNGGKLSHADYYGAARFTFEGNARATIVRNGLRHMRPVTNIKGQTYAWIVDKLTLQVEKLGWFAPYGFAVMTMTNRRASADMYYDAGDLGHSPLAVAYQILEQKPWSPDNQIAWKSAMEQNGKGAKIAQAYGIAKAFDQENKLALNTQAAIRTDESKPTGILQDSLRKGGRGLTLISALNRLATAKQISKLPTSETSEIIAILGKQALFGERKKIALEILLQIVL